MYHDTQTYIVVFPIDSRGVPIVTEQSEIQLRGMRNYRKDGYRVTHLSSCFDTSNNRLILTYILEKEIVETESE